MRTSSRLSWLLLASFLPAQQHVPVPDPATVQRYGPAYRYPQDGWIMLHIEGKPYDRGFQHGHLLAEELTRMIRMLGNHRARGSAEDGWKNERLLCNALFLRGYEPEYLEEMRGIADGANDAGASIFGRRLDVVDVAAVNSSVETMCLEDSLDGLPTGLEDKTFVTPGQKKGDHCSAFAATGPATKDGKIVFGHITMFFLPFAELGNVWLDVQPEQGHRVLMQTNAGGIWSGMDWYQNDAGILLTETTIGQTRFDKNGLPLASRARQSMQYGDSIDQVVEILGKGNNGLYSNEWLLADIKTNEIAMFELGTAAVKLWRSSRDEWVAGTKGFYWGCNNEREQTIRLEQVASIADRPRDFTCHPSDRDCKWLELFDHWNGKIDASFAKTAFTTPPLAASHSFDAKFTTTEMAGRLQSIGLFGTPLGHTWMPSKEQVRQYPEITPLVHHDWSLLGPADVARAPSDAVDLAFAEAGKDDGDDDRAEPPPAWRGSLLPATDADLWLPIAFAAHEHLVAAAKDLAADEQQDERALSTFHMRARWQHAVHALGKDVALSALRPDPRRREWFDLATAKGTLFLDELRVILGDPEYVACMDAFGRAHAGQRVQTADFIAHVEKAAGRSLAALSKRWLDETPNMGAPVWSITAFEEEPEQALIVYGTAREAPTNREAAELLQRRVAAVWHNFDIPLVADRDVTDAQIQSHHLVLVGRPSSNTLGARLQKEAHTAFPVVFGSDSFAVAGATYGHEHSAVIAAGSNPRNERFSVVVYAGLSSEATRELCQQRPDDCEVMVVPHGGRPRSLAVTGAAVRSSNASAHKKTAGR